MSGPRIVAVNEPRVGLRAVIVIRSSARGPAFGGVRRCAYPNEHAGLADAERLAEAMSQKCALAGLAAGGAKAVIFDDPALQREAGYARLGQAIEQLGGEVVCGPDIGTGAAELAILRRATRWVSPAQNDPTRSTAAGVMAGLRGLSRVVFDDEALGDRRYVIQGLGAVGSALAAALLGAGAQVSGWDPDPIARARAAEIGVKLLDEARLMREPCEVFMPCALGQVLTRERCEQGPWAAVCGAANNQLAEPEAGLILHRRGVPWAPDFVVNSGAVIEGVETMLGPEYGARARVVARIEAIAERCAMILERARSQDRGSQTVALELAQAALID